MKLVLFTHSLISDWNHGNAHFLRGVVSELLARGHAVSVYEPRDGWSLAHLLQEQGARAVRAFRRDFPELSSHLYELRALDLDRCLDGADLVLVHEWSPPELVRRLGARRRRGGFRLLFHDTHHRAVSEPAALRRLDLRDYDAVLAFGESLRERYLRSGLAARAFTWHEAADLRRFTPRPEVRREADVAWIGNWGDDERSEELAAYLLEPCRALRVRGVAHGVRYPPAARRALRRSGLAPRGWLPNVRVPEVFARHRVTVHVPRRVYRDALPGIPTIRPFEALACGIPLICAPWEDREGLFRVGRDLLVARSPAEMRRLLRDVLHDGELAAALARQGLETLRARHTCAHRVDELLAIHAELTGRAAAPRPGRLRTHTGSAEHLLRDRPAPARPAGRV